MAKCGYIEVRRIEMDDLRGLCINKNWYTKGNSREYDNLLTTLSNDKENITTDDIYDIAMDIMEHSELELGYTVEAVMFEVQRISRTWFAYKEECEEELMADTVQPVEIGDKIQALGYTFDVAKIIYQDAFMETGNFNEDTRKFEQTPCWDIDFEDSKGGYHHWKSYLDGGTIIRK